MTRLARMVPLTLAHHGLLGDDVAAHRGVAPDHQVGAADVTGDLALDAHVALAFQVARDGKPGVDHGLGWRPDLHAGGRHGLLRGAAIRGAPVRRDGIGFLVEEHVGVSLLAGDEGTAALVALPKLAAG
jgi:hypothetical protein